MPLHLGMTRLLPHQEIEFINALFINTPSLGFFMCMRSGNDKVVKSIISRKNCISAGFVFVENYLIMHLNVSNKISKVLA